MDYTDRQLAGFKAEFARRKRNQFIATAPAIVLILAAVFLDKRMPELLEGVPSMVWGSALVVVVGGLLAFSLRNWRCPACNAYLGKSTSMRHCPRCGVALK
jgi:rubrerythrin